MENPLQDLVQPAWTRLSGGCHPNRDTVGLVRAAGFEREHCREHPAGAVRCITAKVGES